jgi:hypothetical protein
MIKHLLKRIKTIPPYKAIIAGLVAIIGVLTTLLIIKHTETPVEAFSTPRAARLERVDGSVDMMHSLNNDSEDSDTQADWVAATPNAPITVGDRVYARSNSRAAIALTGRNSTRLDSDGLVDVISLDDRQTQLALRSGSATFDVGDLADGELFEVATPNGAIDFLEAGLYQLSIGDDGNTTVSVLRGLAQVVGLAGTGQIRAGQVLTLTGATDEQAALSPLAPELAGDIVDDYYSYRYPDNYDGRYKSYNTYIDDPNYYDPYSHSASYSYLSEDVPGLYDLDRYGDWEEVSDYGRCWAPRGVSADWSPYSDGYWDVNDLWGPTWVSAEPWGYAPYHYGRWSRLNNQRWVWVPEGVVTRPVYAPALVAFIPLQQTNQIAWVPLAPGERYAPRCYDRNFQPRYLDRQGVTVQQTYVNVNYSTAVNVREFRHRIDRRDSVRVDSQLLAQSRPVLDPFAVEGMREMARRGDTDRRVKLPRDVRREIFNRQVVTSVSPRALPGQTDLRKAFQVEPVTDKQRKNKLKIDESGQVANVRRPDRAPMPAPVITPAIKQEREQKMTALAARAEKGDQEARHELRQMKREQRKEDRAIRNQSPAQPQTAPQQTPAQQAVSHREQLHQQMQQEQQQRAVTDKTQREQMREQRKAQRQAQQQQQATTQQQQIEQRKQVEQQTRNQRAQQEAVRQAQVNQQREQNKAQRQAARQQQQPQRQQQVQKQQQVMEQQRQQAAAQQAARQSQANQERAARKAQQQQMEQQRRQQVNQQPQQQQQQRQQRQQQREQQRVQPPVQPRKPPMVMQQTEKNRVVREPQQQRPPRIQQPQPPVVAPQQKQRPPAMANPSAAPRQMDNAPRGEKRRKP